MARAIGIDTKEQSFSNEYANGSHEAGKQVIIDSSAVDATNTPTTTLRKGLVLGEITASGNLAQYDDGASDGTETAVAILAEQINLINEETYAAQDTHATVQWHGRVSEGALIGIDAAGKTDLAAKFEFDD